MEQFPAHRPLTVVQLPDGQHVYADPAALPAQQSTSPQVVHIHQAPPDRTVQRVALGSGVGAGAVAAGVYFGPLLVGALTAIAANLAMLAFIALVLGWSVVTVVRAIGDSTKNTGRRGRKGR
ncbi:DUF6251 family protein [Streptomyces antibioticus]